MCLLGGSLRVFVHISKDGAGKSITFGGELEFNVYDSHLYGRRGHVSVATPR